MKVSNLSEKQIQGIIKIQTRELNLSSNNLFKTFFKKHGEVIEKTKLKLKDNDPISWTTLNKHLEDYPSDRSWVITQYWQAMKMKKDLERRYKSWYNRKVIDCRNRLKKRPSDNPAQWLVEAEMERVYGMQVKYWKIKKDNIDLLVGFYKDLKDLWNSQIDVYQTLSSNIRTEIPYLRNQ